MRFTISREKLQEGLAAAVASFCERLSNKSKTQINFQSFGMQKHIGQQVDLTIYRIIQELVHNIVKHANATTASLSAIFPNEKYASCVEGAGCSRKSLNM